MLFLYFPLAIIVLYAFTTQSTSFTFPPPGLTLEWFRVAFGREDMWAAFRLSLARRGACSAVSRRVGRACSPAPCTGRASSGARPSRSSSCCRSPCPASSRASRCGRRSGQSRRAPRLLDDRDRPHDVLHRDRLQQRGGAAAAHVAERRRGLGRPGRLRMADVPTRDLPNLATALLAGGVLAFALSFDEIIVTTFTRGSDPTLPIWIFQVAVPAAEPPGHERRRADRGHGHVRAGAARADAARGAPTTRARAWGPAGRHRVRAEIPAE